MQFLVLAVLAASCSAAPQMFRAVSGDLFLLRSDIPAVVKIPEPGINLLPFLESFPLVLPASHVALKSAEVVSVSAPVIKSASVVVPAAPEVKSAEVVAVVVDPVARAPQL
ncbi:uncharacterized protein LOC119583885 [Penaeus monodon]|uniref:uncharacterized protein LOC119583885 n=1 Tax=Penaeus monodon TaxID=6687 RepID=UPI0018A709B0|nr:uncharacterized protein LOC119583885 [Penaeus monodon]